MMNPYAYMRIYTRHQFFGEDFMQLLGTNFQQRLVDPTRTRLSHIGTPGFPGPNVQVTGYLSWFAAM